jgi:hypothetical protein
MWVDEAIWGHRLYDEQTPWLTFLELLNILLSEMKQGRGFKEVNGYNSLSYSPQRLLHIRNIVFNNPKMKKIMREQSSDEGRWQTWIEEIDKSKAGVETGFNCIRKSFNSFEEFAWVIELLRSSSIEGTSNKRFTSKFLFPFGPDCLFEDLHEKQFTNDRRFFARTGELAYLMLCRSGYGDEILKRLQPIVFDQTKPLNQLVRTLRIEEDTPREPHKHAYLPYADLPDYKALAQDWIALLTCGILGYDVLPHVVTMLGLHMLLYFLKRGREHADGSSEMQLICEIIAPRKTVVRDLSIDSYQMNNLYSTDAIKQYIQNIAESDEWKNILSSGDRNLKAAEFIKEIFSWESETISEPEAMLQSFKENARNRHAQHIAKIHSNWARSLGLVSRRGTRTLRYAPTDSFLKSLVFTVVKNRMEFQTFLEELHLRYGFVIGHHEAEAISLIRDRKGDLQAFKENAQRLEMRLVSLGLVTRLSDACAYVINPYTAK